MRTLGTVDICKNRSIALVCVCVCICTHNVMKNKKGRSVRREGKERNGKRLGEGKSLGVVSENRASLNVRLIQIS